MSLDEALGRCLDGALLLVAARVPSVGMSRCVGTITSTRAGSSAMCAFGRAMSLDEALERYRDGV
jgi:hypothetical protein